MNHSRINEALCITLLLVLAAGLVFMVAGHAAEQLFEHLGQALNQSIDSFKAGQ